MNYHLHRHGQNPDVIPLEELARRRQSGELTGNEMVWCDGMSQWEPLDKVLGLGTQAPPPMPAGPPPLPKRRRRGLSPLTITAIILGALLMFGSIGYRIVRLTNSITSLGIPRVQIPAQRRDAMDAANKPIQSGTNTLTARDVQARHRAFRLHQYLEGYERNGDRNPAIDPRAIGMISNWINEAYGGPFNTNLPPLEDLSDSLANDPACKDPLVLTISAVNAAELYESIRRLERAVTGFKQSRHTAYPKLYANVVLSDKVVTDKKDRQAMLDQESLDYFKAALDEGISPQDQDDIAESLLENWGKSFYERNADALGNIAHNAGKPYEWLTLVLRGQTEIDRAWAARGGGFADSVTQTGWQSFNTHLVKAHEYLDAAWKLRPDSPLAPSRMIYVSLGASDITEMRLWFDRATLAQIDYATAWGNLRWGLRPRWYGDADSMLALGVSALKTGRFDTDVPRMYFDTVTDLESELKLARGEHIYGREDIWPHLKEMYEGYIAATPEDQNKSGWRSTYAVVAYLAGHLDVSREQLEALKWNPRLWNLSGWGCDLSLMPGEVAARTGPLKTEIAAAETAFAGRHTVRAQQLYAPLLDSKNADDLTRSFISNRLTSLNLRSTYDQQEWINLLPPDDALTGWNIIHGDCKHLPDGTLEVTADKNGHMLYSRMPVDREFEVKGSFVVANSSSKAYQAGIVFGLPDWNNASWYAFRIKRNSDEGDVTSLSSSWSGKQLRSGARLSSTTNSFTFRLQNGVTRATLNGRTVLENIPLPKNARVPLDEYYLGLGAFNDMNTTTIHYTELQVRKLPPR